MLSIWRSSSVLSEQDASIHLQYQDATIETLYINGVYCGINAFEPRLWEQFTLDFAINIANRHFPLQIFPVVLVSLGSLGVSEPKNGMVKVKILAINDLPGQLETPTSKMVIGYNETGIPINVDVGGTEYLATHIRRLSYENPNTFVVSAGDSIDANPLVKASKRDQKSHWVFYPENINPVSVDNIQNSKEPKYL